MGFQLSTAVFKEKWKIIPVTQKGCIGVLYLCTWNPTRKYGWVVRRHAARSATKETLARARTCKTERFRRFFASKATKGRARILLLPQIGGLAELVYCTGLENQRAVKRSKGSNPLASSDGTLADLVYAQDWKSWERGSTPRGSTKKIMRCSPAATRADCKSAAIRLRGFESRHLNDGSIVQLVECRSPKPKVGGSSPSASA